MFAQTHKSVQHKKLPIAKLSFDLKSRKRETEPSRANGTKTSSLDPVLVKTAQKQTERLFDMLLRPDAHKLLTIH